MVKLAFLNPGACGQYFKCLPAASPSSRVSGQKTPDIALGKPLRRWLESFAGTFGVCKAIAQLRQADASEMQIEAGLSFSLEVKARAIHSAAIAGLCKPFCASLITSRSGPTCPGNLAV